MDCLMNRRPSSMRPMGSVDVKSKENKYDHAFPPCKAIAFKQTRYAVKKTSPYTQIYAVIGKTMFSRPKRVSQ